MSRFDGVAVSETENTFGQEENYMSHLDDLPKRGSTHQIEDRSKAAFRAAVTAAQEFVIQSGEYDYGTDVVIEAIDAAGMTNVRVHVQLKGTDRKAYADGSVSVSVTRTNVNYLLMQSGSIFVCYHVPTDRLLVRRVDDVLREYEHEGRDWYDQRSLTVRFKEAFDEGFQKSLKEFVVALARGERDRRMNLATKPPETLNMVREEGAIDLPVPADPKQARMVLDELYKVGDDRTISQSFDKFRAVLGSSDEMFLKAYMAEINLGINGIEYDETRIREGIDALHNAIDGGRLSPGSTLYCVGNGWLALKEYKKARHAYDSALSLLNESPPIAAQCCKNLGTTLEELGDTDRARRLYERALELDPSLAEAHFALGLWHYRNADADLDLALEHFDAIVRRKGSAVTLPPLLGWRADILFKLQRPHEAFRELRTLLHGETRPPWVWPWCARLVATHGRSSVEAAELSVSFWSTYLKEFPDDLPGKKEMLRCVYHLHDSGASTGWDYERFKRTVEITVADGDADAAFFWDRVGHWAQAAGDWSEAEKCYRKAFERSPNKYGYCLGTALNFLQQYDEAIDILLPQAQEHQADAKSWFQLAKAYEGTGNVQGCVDAYKQVLALDEKYDLAWFNLGGICWNSGNKTAAVSIWKEAMERFPTHPLSSKLRNDLPHLLG